MAWLGKQPLPPGLQTRKSNKEIHPCVAAGVAPKACASHAESRQRREHQLQEKEACEKKQAEACACVAAIEDQLEQEDIQCHKNANHPPPHNSTMFRPAVTSTPQPERGVLNLKTKADASSEEDYQPSKGDDEQDNELEEDVAGEAMEHMVSVKHGNTSKVRRQDISTLRTTASSKWKASTYSVSTPVPKKTKKTCGGSAIDVSWLSKHHKNGRQAVAAANGLKISDNDSLVKMGGIIEDDEDDQVEREAMIKGAINPGLPERIGILAPWANLSSTDLQSILDLVYGTGVHILERVDAWQGLMSYRMSTWHNGFLSAADVAIKNLFADSDNYENFKTPEAHKEAVKWWLDFQGPEDQETAPYEFQKCVDDESGECCKSGFCQSPLIIKTFANAHLYQVRCPQKDDPIKKMLVEAWILSLQAVEHVLKQYAAEGDQQIDNSKKGLFSYMNYGNIQVTVQKKGWTIEKLMPRAMRYVATIRKLSAIHWGRILDDANKVLTEGQGKGRRLLKSRSSSFVSKLEMPDVELPKEFVIESDSDLESRDDNSNSEPGEFHFPFKWTRVKFPKLLMLNGGTDSDNEQLQLEADARSNDLEITGEVDIVRTIAQ
ncbi:hypothetical protein C0992_009342 [Termitomyces sp. T32_za158]|nr:hypothetical protein C0992_009342 [Termitomyces sp. T32_za158]